MRQRSHHIRTTALIAATWTAFIATGHLSVPIAHAAAAEVKVGLPSVAGDIPLFIALKRGYFKQEDLDVQLIKFPSGARMVAPLSTGELQVGAGGVSAGLFNAVARGIDIRIVSDKGLTVPGQGTQAMLVRKELYHSGGVRSLKDLKGRKIAMAAPGSSAATVLYKMLAAGGLKESDVEIAFLSFPQHLNALMSGAVDAALTAQPTTNVAIKRGVAQPIANDYDVYPVHQIAVMLYSGVFAKSQPEAAFRFMRAYIRGVRDQNDALAPDGSYAGSKGDAIVAILAEYGPFKDPAIYRSFILNKMDPDGEPHIPSIQEDLDLMHGAGLVKDKFDVRKMIDLSFRDRVLKELGRYKW